MTRFKQFIGRILCAAAVGCPMAFGLPGAALAEDPPKLSAEMRVLDAFIGTWDEVVSNKPTEWTSTAGKSTAVTKRAWILGGQFFRGEGTWQPAKTEFLHLMSYDADAKAYRSWYFDAAGAMPRGVFRGTWDEKTRTLASRETDEAGNTSVGTNTVTDKDHTEWTLVTKNPDGKVVLDMAGKCTRRKE